MNTKKGILAVIALALAVTMVAVFAFNPIQRGDGPITLRLASPMATGDNVTLAYDKLSEIIEEKSNGQMKIDVYSNAVLGGDRATTEAVQSGTLDMASCSSPNFSGFVPEFMAFDLPYVTSPEYQENLYAAIDNGELGEYFRNVVRDKGFELLMFTEYGYRNFATVGKPIHTADDFKRVKMRTTDSPIEIAVVRALRATAMPVAWGETYTALSQGAIDGEGNTWSLLYTAKHGEVLEYGIQSEHNYSMHILVMNDKRYEQLTDQQKKWLQESCQEALDWQRHIVRKNEAANKEHMKDLGVDIYDMTPEEKQDLIDLTAPIKDRYVGKDIPQIAYDLVRDTQRPDFTV